MKIYKNKYFGIIFSLILSIFLLPNTNVYAGHGEHRRDSKEWEEKANKMYDKLQLNEEQRSALKAHKQKHRAQRKALHEKMKVKKEALRKAMQEENFDKQRVRALNEEIKSLHNSLSDQRLEGVMEVREILTPEQFSQFNEFREKRHDKRKQKRGDYKERFKEKMKDQRSE